MNLKQFFATAGLAVALVGTGIGDAYNANAATTATTPAAVPAPAKNSKCCICAAQRGSCCCRFCPLSPDKVKLFQDTIKQAHAKNKALGANSRQLHADLDKIMVAEKFDSNAYLAKNAEIDKIRDQQRANMEQAFVSVMAKFTPAERKIMTQLRKKYLNRF